MPSYAATLQRPSLATTTSRTANTPIPRLARLLADFHTSINIPALELFDGNVDRFLVCCLLLRTSLSRPTRDGTISIHSAALSLGRPFETVRRHVSVLIDMGLCRRTPIGVTMSEDFWTKPDNARRLSFAHDCFVRMVADGVKTGVFTALPPPGTGTFRLEDGVCAAADLLLAFVDGNRPQFAEATDLAIFSAVLHANAQRLEEDNDPIGWRTLQPRHAVRVAQIARALHLPDTTVRRRVAPLTGPDRAYSRTRAGLLVAIERLTCDQLSSVEPRHGSVRLILNRAAAAGLSFAMPTLAYRNGRPDSPRID